MIRDLVAEAAARGLSEQRACQVLGLTPRTLQRWRQPVLTPPAGPRPRPVNALTRPEAAAVVSLIRSPEHADQSCRELALSLSQGIPAIPVSHVTVWRYQVALACNGPRGRQRHAHPLSAPDTAWVSGPNQLWDYDVTWLTTWERSVFLFLYSLLDHFSRKIVAWLVRETFTSEHLQTLWDHGVLNEGLLDVSRDQWPQALSDRGTPMRAYSTRQYFEKLGLTHLFSRPRRPNDNPRIEAHFGTVKTHPAYPGRFADPAEAVTYFTQFYDWYNHIHPLTTLCMLTPNQVHTGQMAALLSARLTQQTEAQTVRRWASHSPFMLEDLMTDPLPDVSHYPIYSWAGPTLAPAKEATPLA